MPKEKIYLWQIYHNALATRANLLNRGLNLDPICPLCHSELESTSHLFTQCFITKETWDLAYQHKWIELNISPVGIMSILELFKFTRTETNLNQTARITSLMWSIWKSRNVVVFKNEIYNCIGTIIRATKTLVRMEGEENIRFRCNIFIPSIFSSFISWAKPPGGFIKINFDESKSSSSAARGFVTRSWDGRFLQVGTTNLKATLVVLVAETTAVRNGVRTAVHAGCRSIVLEYYNQVLIKARRGGVQIPWEIQTLVEDTNIYLNSCNRVYIQHIFKGGNRATEWLARFGLSISSSILRIFVPCVSFLPILIKDNLCRTLEKRAT